MDAPVVEPAAKRARTEDQPHLHQASGASTGDPAEHTTNGAPAAAAASLAPQQQQQQQQQPLQQPQVGQGPRRKPKKVTPESEVRMAIHAAAKEQDVAAGLEVYDRAVAQGVKLTADLYTSLLYLCSGGEGWDLALRSDDPAQGQQPPPQDEDGQQLGGQTEQQQQEQEQPEEEQQQALQQQQRRPPPPAEVLVRRAQELFDAMASSEGKLALNEMCFTALARLAAAAGDPGRALEVVEGMAAAGVAPKLRSFVPALAGFAEAGDAARAFEVDAAIQAQGLELCESEYGRLLQAATAPGGSWEQAAGVLRRLGRELTVLQEPTLRRIRALFASPTAAAALADDSRGGGGDGEGSEAGEPGAGPPTQQQPQQDPRRWLVEPSTVDAQGVCSSCGGQLRPEELSQEEFGAFTAGIAALATKQERRPNEFEAFRDWLGRHGPFGAVVDGANVALYGQNFEAGGFTLEQIK